MDTLEAMRLMFKAILALVGGATKESRARFVAACASAIRARGADETPAEWLKSARTLALQLIHVCAPTTHAHDCSECVYLGNTSDGENGPADLYYCAHKGMDGEATVLARFGTDGDYSSTPEVILRAGKGPAASREAWKRAKLFGFVE